MTDPRNVAHDKKVNQEKKHHGQDTADGASETPQPGKKPHMKDHARDHSTSPDDAPPGEQQPGE